VPEPWGLAFDANGEPVHSSLAGGVGKIYKTPPGGGVGVPFVSSGFTDPRGIAFDAAGTMYVVDFGSASMANSGRILKVTSAGVTSVFKSGLAAPLGIAIDPSGNVYVGLYISNKVVRITPAGVRERLRRRPRRQLHRERPPACL